MKRREAIDLILSKQTNNKRKAAELDALMGQELVDLAKHIWEVEKTHGPKWVERFLKDADKMFLEKRDVGLEQEESEPQ